MNCKIATAQPNHRGLKHDLNLFDSFEFQGPHGQHLCLVTDVLGYSLQYIRTIRDRHVRRLPSALTKRVAKQTLLALEYLHDVCGIVQADLKPDNILFHVSDVDAVVAHELVDDPSRSYGGGTHLVPPVVPIVSQPILDPVPPTQLEAVLADVGHSHWKDHHFQELI
ncbi:hypothetical protein D9757_005045 [Collybiopsis confluens]|uniref:non-specific serine/threonine protein kinase n=1 Tax=Collybiopsis confluens TaxID=2823264 RepID=A0A8H5HTH8_9AGAR|nr:hypothetical protein D9757_005045 [Collybiopsis confluens]